MVQCILKMAAGIIPKARRVIQRPMSPQFEESAWGNHLDRRFELLAGRSLNPIPVLEAVKQVRAQVHWTPLEQIGDGGSERLKSLCRSRSNLTFSLGGHCRCLVRGNRPGGTGCWSRRVARG